LSMYEICSLRGGIPAAARKRACVPGGDNAEVVAEPLGQPRWADVNVAGADSRVNDRLIAGTPPSVCCQDRKIREAWLGAATERGTAEAVS
jgi:hypothetical protein